MPVVGAVGIFFCLWVAVLGCLATRNPKGCFSVTFYRCDYPCAQANGHRTRCSSGRKDALPPLLAFQPG
jgi:hypothetical protein